MIQTTHRRCDQGLHARATRREFLQRAGMGLASLGVASLLAEDAAPASPLAPRPPHFRPRARHVIHLFMNGGPSHIDTFDPKPALAKYAGQRLPLHLETERPTGAAFPSPFFFRRYGQSGLEVSELFADVASRHADDLCVIRSMHADAPIHEQCLMLMNCGDGRLARPSVGAWLTYGLGSLNQNLPGFVVLIPSGLPVKGADNWRSAFLPGAFQGTYVATAAGRPGPPIENLHNPRLSAAEQREQIDLLEQLNRRHREARGNDDELEARIHNYEIAYRMQMEASDAFDLEREPQWIHELYGNTQQARQMLIARRLVERGVRYVQLYHGNVQPWDSHDNLETNHRRLAGECSQGIAALLTDLKQRGLLQDTLVIWGGEFGRTPTVELPVGGTVKSATGRDHNHHGFTIWLAGGGVKGGMAYGATDEFGFRAVHNRVHIHDLHATLLHLMGLDHEQLTYRYAGRDFRLTDVEGNVVREIMA
jgi:hypothetical protein